MINADTTLFLEVQMGPFYIFSLMFEWLESFKHFGFFWGIYNCVKVFKPALKFFFLGIVPIWNQPLVGISARAFRILVELL